MATLRELLAPGLSRRAGRTAKRRSSPTHLLTYSSAIFLSGMAFLLALLAVLSPAMAQMQQGQQQGQQQRPIIMGTQAVPGRSYPSPTYLAGFANLNDGDYKAAFDSFRRELTSSYRMGQTRWIDSICGYTMAGESEYRMGHYAAALDDYKSALQLYVQNGNWMLSVQFKTAIPTPLTNNRGAPWGHTTRGTRPARFPDTIPITIGMNLQQANAAVQQGGTVMGQQAVSMQVHEIIRCTCLAIERRRELLGPVSTYDPLTDEVMQIANRRLGPAGHWSEAWLDAEQGMAYAAAGKTAQAISVLKRSLQMSQGQFDHPLTPLSLLVLGKLSMESGDYKNAGNYFEEATYSAYDFADVMVLEEAFRNLLVAHLMTGDAAILDKPLATAIEWSHNHFRELEASLLLTAAENLAIRDQTQQAVALLGQATGTMARHLMSACEIGARLNYLTALTQYQHGAAGLAAGDAALANALAWEREGSRWLFQIGLVDNLCVTNPSGKFSLRTANDLYQQILRDPGPTDWALTPLESLGVLNTPHPLPFEHWFEKVVQESSSLEVAAEPALEVADLSRRHRFLSSLPSGGRMLALRWVLEAPEDQLTKNARLQRQELLSRFPKYAEASTKAKQLRQEIAQAGLNTEARDARAATTKLTELGNLTSAQEAMLREIAVRREAADMVFPPIRKTKEVQQSLPQDSLLLAYFNTSRFGYGWFLSNDRITMWKTDSTAVLEKRATALLKSLGNYDANHELQDSQLAEDDWKQAGTDLISSLLKNPKTVFRPEYKELVIVPDGLLWYVPFEALPLGDPKENRPLISRVRIRYVPTTALAMPQHAGRKGAPDIGIALDKLYPNESPDFAKAALDEISHVAPRAVALKNPLPGASPLLGSVLDGLIVIDDIPAGQGPYEWSPMPLDKGKTGASSLAAWMMLPWKSTDTFVLPGFHSAAENSLKSANTANGNELFQAVTGLMSTGARTVLISRWRTGGQTTIDLVREFVQELPQSSADDAWQRAVQLVSQAPLDPLHEPRLRRKPDAGPMNAEHPFFWSGYLLADTGMVPPKDEPLEQKPLANVGLQLPAPKNPPANPAPNAAPNNTQQNEMKGDKEAKPDTQNPPAADGQPKPADT